MPTHAPVPGCTVPPSLTGSAPLPPTLLVDTAEAARLLGVSTTYVRNEMRAGRLPSVKLGRARRLRRVDVEQYVDQLTAAVAEHLGTGVVSFPDPMPARPHRRGGVADAAREQLRRARADATGPGGARPTALPRTGVRR